MHLSYLVFIVVTLTVQSVLSESFVNIVAGCQKKLEYDGDMKNLDYKDDKFPEKAKCVMSCALDEKGVIKNGIVERPKAKLLIEEMFKDEGVRKKFLAAVEECDDISALSAKGNKCETAYQLLKCIYSKAEDEKV